ncbi:Uncharacterized protein TCM_020254 [Theobroma cacao]|uniref:Uncharacterized protein n=1 Tax=Theobroma cacao TaxID=3641 RepID=A0A061ELF9_THECC|nr:Uncharacterized protein TCM_020254 [Theobroma cacao]
MEMHTWISDTKYAIPYEGSDQKGLASKNDTYSRTILSHFIMISDSASTKHCHFHHRSHSLFYLSTLPMTMNLL